MILFNTKNAHTSNHGPSYIVVFFDMDVLPLLSPLLALHEGQWMKDNVTGKMYRVDPENPAFKLQRHIHIADPKHTGSKNKQASWNLDGSRHDGVAFNDALGRQTGVRDLARRALNLGPEIKLEALTSTYRLRLLLEGIHLPKTKRGEPIYLRAFVDRN